MALSLIIICALFIGDFFLSKSQQPSHNENNKTALYSDRYDGFSSQTQITKRTILENGNIFENIDTLETENKSHKISNALTLTPTYEVQYQIKTAAQKYNDIYLFINGNDMSITAKLSGLIEKEEISLAINDDVVFKNIPTDWAGQIEFKTKLKDKAEQNPEICVTMAEQKSVCHVMGGIA